MDKITLYVVGIPVGLLLAIWFFWWMYRKINDKPLSKWEVRESLEEDLRETEMENTQGDPEEPQKPWKRGQEKVYRSETILRIALFIGFFVALMISGDRDQSGTILVWTMILSLVIRFTYQRRRRREQEQAEEEMSDT